MLATGANLLNMSATGVVNQDLILTDIDTKGEKEVYLYKDVIL